MPELLDQISYEEKKSRFIALMYHIEHEDDNKQILLSLKDEHKEAKHLLHVCRYQNHFSAFTLEASDDREPISSMKKASRYFERDNITDMGIYIVRYYGGRELGASHLDQVYFKLAMKLFENYKTIKKEPR